ncbi:MAG: protein-export membrane protein SecF [Candidatus Tectomicrobia bacterium RIFCSPLOWO2_12_FULL_69_37]|nr:MAG: protein-export membrane protein SecF [Candidatus Tectomicrobia bacterium RIFCSPLOWO2_02_FULL_70_19]OGL61448.1 MAG: protein-export membrane protein SecF [Candidatus Tectomicrobia bacterium RIFCSPLOWO2_12_FULL_69_37]
MEFFKPDLNFDFVGKRRIFAGISCAAVLLSVLLLAVKGLNYGIDFTGGTIVQVAFKEKKPIAEVRRAVSGLGLGDTVIQEFGSDREFLIRVQKMRGAAEGADKQITDALAKAFGRGAFEMRRTESVGPQVGDDLKRKAMSSVIFAWFGILIYVGFRFRFVPAAASIVALIHDVVITLGALALTGKEFNLPVVAAILTIIGYSINDTIVVFDRIRENTRLSRRSELGELINASINQTLSRTILTGGTTLLTVLAFLFLGGEVISDFAFTLLVGIVVGTYSSIYVASPILLAFPGYSGGTTAPRRKKAPARA